MKCLRCGCERSSVVDSRSTPGFIRRRRECVECGYRFTTYERIEETMPMVLKKDGTLEQFIADKIKQGILKACQKRPVSPDTIDNLIANIQSKIVQMDKAQISSHEIGELVMEQLKSIDKVAYVRFASVYREFSDVGEFVGALNNLAMEERRGEKSAGNE